MTQREYIEYLIATTENYTCTNLSEHLEGEAAQSHDVICDFLSGEKLTPRGLWRVVQKVLEDGPESFLIFDDSVQDKRYSSKIELVKLQYSGAEGGLVRGIGVLNLLHSTGKTALARTALARTAIFTRWTSGSMLQSLMAKPKTTISARC